MTATARRYTSEPGFTDDFFAVREFLVRIGVWESDGEVVGLVTYEEGPGDAYFAVDPAHRGLLPEMIESGLVSRTRDGAEYWRTHVTEFDGA